MEDKIKEVILVLNNFLIVSNVESKFTTEQNCGNNVYLWYSKGYNVGIEIVCNEIKKMLEKILESVE